MIKIQDRYIEYIESSTIILKDIKIDTNNLNTIQNRIEKIELLVPVIGAFSAGKSTLINSFLEDELLSTNLTPETALATELRYSKENYIEAIKEDDSIDRYEINQDEEIKKRAKEYKYLKYYLDNKKLKEIEPLVLVDMPGFDSPLELHNQAILNYLNRGIYFIVLTSIEEGGLSKSIIRELRNITEFGKGFSFCLSKTNLRHSDDINDVQDRVKEQLEDEFDFVKNIILIDDNGGSNLEKILKSIDTEVLFKLIFVNELKSEYQSLESAINTTISTLKNSKEDSLEAIKDIKEWDKKIIDKKERMITEAKDRYSNRNVEIIINAVSNELLINKDSLLNSALSNIDTFSREINEIVKTKLIYEIQLRIREISRNIVDDFSIELKSIDNNLSDFSIDAEWIDNIGQSIKQVLESAQQGLGKLGDFTKDKSGKIYRVVTTILGVTTSVLSPILEVIIIFLPEIISFFTKSSKEKKQKDEVLNKMHSEIIPSIKSKLRAELPIIFNEQVNNLIHSISSEFEGQLTQKREEIEKAMIEKEITIIDTEDKIEKLDSARKKLQSLTTETLYKGE